MSTELKLEPKTLRQRWRWRFDFWYFTIFQQIYCQTEYFISKTVFLLNSNKLNKLMPFTSNHKYYITVIDDSGFDVWNVWT